MPPFFYLALSPPFFYPLLFDAVVPLTHQNQIKAKYSEGLEEAVQHFRDLQIMMHDYFNAGSQDSPARHWYMPESDYFFYSADKTKWWEKDYPPAVAF